MADFEKDYLENEDVEVEETDVEDETPEEEGEELISEDMQEASDNIEAAQAEEDAQYDEAGEPIEGTEAAEYAQEQDNWDKAVETPEGTDVPVDFEFIIQKGEDGFQEGNDMIDLVGPSDNSDYNAIVVENEEGVITLPDEDGTFVTQDLTGLGDDDQDEIENTSLDSEEPFGLDGEGSDAGTEDYPEESGIEVTGEELDEEF